MSFHRDLVLDDIHTLVARIYADITARDADTDFNGDAANVNKAVCVISPQSIWILIDTAPTWLEVTNTQSDEFTELTDTPASYSGEAGKTVKVNSGETGLEFGTAFDTFTELTDTPSTYTGQAYKVPQVNSGETALQFHDTLRLKRDNSAPIELLNTFEAKLVFFLTENNGDFGITLNVNESGQHEQSTIGISKLLSKGKSVTRGSMSINAGQSNTAGQPAIFDIGLSVWSSDQSVRVGNPNNAEGLKEGGGVQIADADGDLVTDVLRARTIAGLSLMDDSETLGLIVEDGAQVNIPTNLGLTGTDAYLNFASDLLASGYGFRDNAGVIQFKDSGGVWSDITTGSSPWNIVTSTINYVAGNVGIGTASPAVLLDVAGQVNISASIGLTGSNAYLNFGSDDLGSGYGIRDNAGVMESKDSADSAWRLLSPWQNTGLDIYYSAGKVGVGIAAPVVDFEVRGHTILGGDTFFVITSGADNNDRLTQSIMNVSSDTAVSPRNPMAGYFKLLPEGLTDFDTNGIVTALYGTVDCLDGTTIAETIGVRGRSRIATTAAAIDDMKAVHAHMSVAEALTGTQVVGVDSLIQVGFSGVLNSTNAYLFKGRLDVIGTINSTNFYGLHLPDISASGATNNWAIRTEGGDHYLGGWTHIDSQAANTAPILRLDNTAGFFDIFRTDATPEAAITSPIGGLANNASHGHLYIKESAGSGNTGWQKFATSEELANTGVLSGCKVSVNGVDDELIDISSGEYEIEGVHYDYAGVIGQNPGFSTSPPEDTVFVYLGPAGLVLRNVSGFLDEWTDSDFQTQATLARLTAVSDVDPTVSLIRDDRWITAGRQIDQRIYQTDVFGGGVYALSSGGLIEENGTTAYQMDQTADGVLFDSEQVKHPLAAIANIGGLRIIASGPTILAQDPLIAPESYDDGAGGLTALLANRWASHTILKSPKGTADDGTEGIFFMIISSDQYTTRSLAEAAPIEFGPFAGAQVVPVAKILVTGGGTGIVDSGDVRPFGVRYGAPN